MTMQENGEMDYSIKVSRKQRQWVLHLQKEHATTNGYDVQPNMHREGCKGDIQIWGIS